MCFFLSTSTPQTTAPKDEGKKKKKGGGGKTVSSVYLVSLTELMATLVGFCSIKFITFHFLPSITASPTLCVAWCPIPIRSLVRWNPL